jgi:DNA primase
VIRKAMGDSILKEARVLWNDKDSGDETVKFQHHRLVMPMYDANGRCVSIMGRTIYSSDKQKDLGLPKYINTGYHKRSHLFGLNLAKECIRATNKALVVEGNLDVIKAYQNSIFNVVCATGSNFTLEQMILLSRYTDNIYLGFDNDSAGDDATAKALLLSRNGVSLQEKRVPKKYKDLDEYLTSKVSPLMQRESG